ncbi:OmpA family protein [Leptotrichia sp. HSP-536]|uniref:OmpA family protein n=1 Tax=Leptotrichia alba TaxID=3239304 RepID=A0AB39V1D3_9FUSO
MKKPTLIAVSSMVAMSVPTVSEKVTTSDMRKDIIRANVADMEKDNENDVPTLETPNPEKAVNNDDPDLITVTLTPRDDKNEKESKSEQTHQKKDINSRHQEMQFGAQESVPFDDNSQENHIQENSTNNPQRIQILKSEIITLRAEDLNFHKNSISLKKEAYSVLEDIKNYIEKNDYLVSIVGYTDESGITAYNNRLSLRRAEKVGSKLLELGLSKDRILDFIGRGENNPINSNETEKGREGNRRVEFRFIKKGQI